MHPTHSRYAKENIEFQTVRHYLMDMVKKRKRRSDRNHLVYCLKVRNLEYIGVTNVSSTPQASLRRRWKKHINRAKNEDKSWTLCQAIRKHGPEKFDVQIIVIIRGKTAAHEYERQLIRERKPKLNSDVRGVAMRRAKV